MDAGKREDNSLIHFARFTSSKTVEPACGTWNGTSWTMDRNVVSCPSCIEALQAETMGAALPSSGKRETSGS
jgi:hypothetical protein